VYVPTFNAMDEGAARDFVARTGAAQLITTADDGYPAVTLLPVIWSGDRVLAHFAKANPHWRQIQDGAPALFVCQGHQAYISPGWYAAKAEHGRVVPTWNYSAVELRGRVTVSDDRIRVREIVTALTDRHESGRENPWAVTDAPERFIEGQLAGIVAVEMVVESVTGKAKLSQNRSDADQAGVISGLDLENAHESSAVALEMRNLQR
jgi:transcriptional regulator